MGKKAHTQKRAPTTDECWGGGGELVDGSFCTEAVSDSALSIFLPMLLLLCLFVCFYLDRKLGHKIRVHINTISCHFAFAHLQNAIRIIYNFSLCVFFFALVCVLGTFFQLPFVLLSLSFWSFFNFSIFVFVICQKDLWFRATHRETMWTHKKGCS